MVDILIDGKKYQLPSSFNELGKKQLQIVCYVRSENLDFDNYDMLSFNAIRISLFGIITRVPLTKLNKITAAEWVDILPYLNWIFKVPDFNQNPLPKIRKRFTSYYGPTGMLDKASFEEMMSADTAFVAASNSKSFDSLALLAAILYRPIRKDISEFYSSNYWNGDVREPFNMEKVKSRVPMFKKLSKANLVAIFLYYWSFRESKLLKYERVFRENGGTKMQNRGWAGTLLEISHLPVFGNIDDTAKQNWNTVLFEMDRQIEISDVKEKEIEKQKLKNR